MAPDPTTKYQELRQSIAAEKERRVHEHRANLAMRARLAKTLGVTERPLNLFAQGDSWFDYPLPVFGGPSDVVAHLRKLPSLAPEILSMAVAGEAAEQMFGVQKLHELIKHLTSAADGPFDAILLSAGGNDIAGDQFRLWLNDSGADAPPSAGLNLPRLDAILTVVKAGYDDLITVRNKIAPEMPIFAHSYDFAIPGKGGVCGKGPWLEPGLTDRGWKDAAATQIVHDLLERFAKMLDDMAGASPHFIHVKTQGTIKSDEWDNELHPKPNGFAKITAKFIAALRNHFPGRI
jgi:hypothetical protein